MPDYATISAPLSDATKKSMPTTTVNWSSECDRAFIRLKEILCSDPVLQASNFDEVFILQTDASEEGLGAVLSQADHKGQERPVAYISRKLLPRETYFTIEKEALAIKWAMEKLKVYLLGSEFMVQTDHAPLQFMERHANNARVVRWGLALQPFRFSVRYRQGHCNQNADSLSRL